MTVVRRLLLVALFLEIGFLLAVVPWSTYWDRNYFAQWVPALQDAMKSNFVRGAITGLGLLNLTAGVVELVALVSGRRHEPQPPPA